MKWTLILALGIGVLSATPAVSYADDGGGAKWTLSLTSDYTPSSWTNEVGWGDRAVNKVIFGAKNLLLGWTDLFVEPKDALDSGANILTGLGWGLKDGLENTLGGAVHLITFPITELDAPLPEGGVFTE